MSVLRDLIALFKKRKRSSTTDQFFNTKIDELFTFLTGKISSSNEAHSTKAFITNFLKLNGKERKEKLPECYLFVEKYLTDIDSEFKLSRNEIRALVKVNYASLLSIPDFALIFEHEDKQEFELCKIFLIQVLTGLTDLLGDGGSKKLQAIKTYAEELPGAFPSNNPLNETGFIPSSFDDWVQFLQRLSKHTYLILLEKLGEEAALRRFDNGYKILAQKYIVLDTFQVIISLLPEKLMDEDRVSTLSKHQVEKLLLKKADHFEQLTKKLAEKNLELQKTQQLLIEAKNIAEQASKTKAMFLANMSHEIRTPMNAVIGMAEILKETSLSKDQELYTDTIYKSGFDLLQLVNEILDYSKIESGKLELEEHPFDLYDLATDVANLLILRAEEKNIELIYYVDENVPKNVLSDSVRIKQILLNLVGNAIKFTDTGQVIFEIISKRNSKDVHDLEFRVIDSGIGIPRNKLNLIFDSFSQVDATTTRNYGGTGLGLAITKSLITMLKGTIKVESEMGKGSTFHFSIPVKATSKENSSDQPLDFKNKKVILVEQSNYHRNYLAKKLASWGIKVYEYQYIDELISNLKKIPKTNSIFVDHHSLSSIETTLRKSFVTYISEKKIPLVEMISFGNTPKKSVEYTSYSLTRPIRRSDLIETLSQTLLQKTSKPKTVSISNKSTHVPKSISVLVADDNSTNLLVAKNMLSTMGYIIDTAINGQEVIDKLEAKYYDLILMDVQMPELDGIQATQKIRMKVVEPRQPVIVALTANVSEEDKQVCLFAGMNDYLNKPFKKDQIISIIEKWFPDK